MRKIKLFITGMSGTAGRALARLSVNNGYLVAGTIYQNFPPELKEDSQKGLIRCYQIDLRNLGDIEKSTADFQPDAVIHLAGKVLGRSDKQTSNPAVYTENLTIFKNVLSAAKGTKSRPKFILSSGCLVYDKATSPEIITEVPPQDLPQIDPAKEPYRASKLDQEKLLTQSKLDYIITRPTQFTGPGKIPGVVEFYIAREILEILRGKQKIISVRNKFGEVDMLDARDVASAYLTLVKKGESGKIYHICSGQPVTVEHLAKTFLEVAGLDSSKSLVKSEGIEQINYFRFSSTCLRSLGWNPSYSVKDALTSYWEYFKNQEK